jgi:hypothetical protein
LSPLSDLRILRGAASGVIAAAVWAAQQPLDKRVFGCDYDDVEMLGRLVVDDEHYYAPGLSLHLLNGGLFGAVYSLVAPSLRGPAWLRGSALALAENTALWPLISLMDRYHPAHAVMPKLSGSRRALYQASWRHLLFGAVLGELERRLAPPPVAGDGSAVIETVYSSNGHGNIEHASVPMTSSDFPPGDLPS